MRSSNKYVVDTNVLIVASCVGREDTDFLDECIKQCIQAIKNIRNGGTFIMDEGHEIFNEYRNNKEKIKDAYFTWLRDQYWQQKNQCERVPITRKGDSYCEFPSHPGLAKLDPSDRKFIAVAYAHKEKPPVLQAVDSKWWGWQRDLKCCGIKVHFLCSAYVEDKYHKKMTS